LALALSPSAWATQPLLAKYLQGLQVNEQLLSGLDQTVQQQRLHRPDDAIQQL
jgi:hypothetical protein